MRILIFLKDGLNFEMSYPKRKNESDEKFTYKFSDNQEMIEAFKRDSDYLTCMASLVEADSFVTLEDAFKSVSFRLSDLRAYQIQG